MPDLGLNMLDFFLLFMLFLGGLVGLVRGIGPQLMSAASIWLGLLLTLWTYRLLSVNIFMESGIFGKTTADAFAFMIMFIIWFHSIRLVVKLLTKPPEEKKRKPKRKGQVGPVETPPPSPVQRFVVGPINSLGGILLGVFLTTLWTAIILGVMQFFFQVDPSQVGNATGAAVPGQGLVSQMRSSTLVPYFNRVLWILVRSLELFVLDDSADILSRVTRQMFSGGGGE